MAEHDDLHLDDQGRRKRPRQPRAQVTVDAIIEATAQLLLKLPVDKVTTNAVAERAGVSVGSLYQYFADRDALIRALLEQRRTVQLEHMVAALSDTQGASLREFARHLVEAMLAPTTDRDLERILNAEMFRLRGVDGIFVSEEAFARGLVPFFALRGDELREQSNPFAAAWLVVHTVASVRLQRIMSDRLVELVPGDVMVDELTEMLVRYLGREP